MREIEEEKPERAAQLCAKFAEKRMISAVEMFGVGRPEHAQRMLQGYNESMEAAEKAMKIAVCGEVPPLFGGSRTLRKFDQNATQQTFFGKVFFFILKRSFFKREGISTNSSVFFIFIVCDKSVFS